MTGAPRTFLLAGHRGSMADCPENTMLSFTTAERAGADEIELDVRLTRDGQVVVLHDRTLERTAAAPGPHLDTPVEELTLAEVRSVDLGSGQRVPTLDEVLDRTRGLVQVEVKAPAAAGPLVALLRARGDADRARCTVISFHPQALVDVMAGLPDLPRGTGLLVADIDGEWRDAVAPTRARTIMLPWRGLTRSLVDGLHDAGLRVHASLLEGPGEVRRIVDLDVDATTANHPRYARELLAAHPGFVARFPGFGRAGA
ncbi:glycerophosphodiester phosphodiesterase [Clavibacter michiganensis]|uniref:glycerophosphodiester phosphodiesterase n=1 Tax=Clavibacter michiganensis TaxID=28447 RepID=UPI003EC0718E